MGKRANKKAITITMNNQEILLKSVKHIMLKLGFYHTTYYFTLRLVSNIFDLIKPLCELDTLPKPSRQRYIRLGFIFQGLWSMSWFNLTQTEKKCSKSWKSRHTFILSAFTKYELWLDKRQLNVACCACDISCNRKMDSPSKYMIYPIGLRPSVHRIHQISHLSLFQMLIVP